MTKAEQFKSQFSNFKGNNMWVEMDSGDIITGVNVVEDKITYRYSFVEQCGCCVGSEEDIELLNWYMDYMSEGDFEKLTKEINNQ